MTWEKIVACVLVCVAGGATRAGEPRGGELPKEVVAAWEKGGLRISCGGVALDLDDRWFESGLGGHKPSPKDRRVLPTFCPDYSSRKAWPADGVKGLPRPTQPFGIDLSAFTTHKVTGEQLSQLEGFDQLTHLDLSNLYKTDPSALKALSGMKMLQGLRMNYGSPTAEALTEVAKVKTLRSLDLFEASDSPDQPLGDDSVTKLAGHSALSHLTLAYSKVTDVGVKELAKLPQLRALDLSNTRVTDAGIRALAEAKNLKFLRLGRDAVRGPGFAALEKLDVWGLDIGLLTPTDEGVRAIGQIKSLQWLHLGTVSVKGLAALSELGNLQEISLSVTGENTEKLEVLTGLKGLKKVVVYIQTEELDVVSKLRDKYPMWKIERQGR